MKSSFLNPPNARFWTWCRDGFVKLTLRPGQSFRWSRSERTDEGWSSEAYRWTWDGQVLLEDYGTDGRDCDGRVSTDAQFHATQLHAVPAISPFNPPWPEPLQDIQLGFYLPAWVKGPARQRDYSAEDMNY